MAVLESERDVETKILQQLFTSTLGYPEDSLRFDEPVRLTFGREKKIKKAALVAYHNKKTRLYLTNNQTYKSVGFEIAVGASLQVPGSSWMDMILRAETAMNEHKSEQHQRIGEYREPKHH
ncbi:MAG TPA: hypothetical protein VNE40_00315 [Candidatus Dormibacteraeota bacterium]|nr:hypothetical protein [Candidatus Dormibacteraeota bacterium]